MPVAVRVPTSLERGNDPVMLRCPRLAPRCAVKQESMARVSNLPTRNILHVFAAACYPQPFRKRLPVFEPANGTSRLFAACSLDGPVFPLSLSAARLPGTQGPVTIDNHPTETATRVRNHDPGVSGLNPPPVAAGGTVLQEVTSLKHLVLDSGS